MKFWRKRLGVIAVFSMFSAAGGAQQPVVINVGVPNAATDVGYFVAHKRGYFAAEGLDVRFQTFDSAARMIPILAAGDLQVGAGGPSAGLYNAIARDIDIRIVADKSRTRPCRAARNCLCARNSGTAARCAA